MLEQGSSAFKRGYIRNSENGNLIKYLIKEPIATFTSIFKCGKYRGLTVEEIIQKDVGYIKKYIEKNLIELDNETYNLYKKRLNK